MCFTNNKQFSAKSQVWHLIHMCLLSILYISTCILRLYLLYMYLHFKVQYIYHWVEFICWLMYVAINNISATYVTAHAKEVKPSVGLPDHRRFIGIHALPKLINNKEILEVMVPCIENKFNLDVDQRSVHGAISNVLSQGQCMQNMNSLPTILQKNWYRSKIEIWPC